MISFMWIDCQSTNFMTELLFPFVQSITSFLIGIMEAFLNFIQLKRYHHVMDGSMPRF